MYMFSFLKYVHVTHVPMKRKCLAEPAVIHAITWSAVRHCGIGRLMRIHVHVAPSTRRSLHVDADEPSEVRDTVLSCVGYM